MSSYIVSSKGFFKGFTFDEKFNKESIWTDKVREAKPFMTAGKAKKYITSANLDAFVWNPYAEEPIRDKYEVIKKSSQFYDRNNDLIHEWIIRKAMMKSNTDAKFIETKQLEETKYYTLEEAQKIAFDRNMAMFAELKTKLNIE